MIIDYFEFDFVLQAALIQERLGDADTTGVADADHIGFHGETASSLNHDYWVITKGPWQRQADVPKTVRR